MTLRSDISVPVVKTEEGCHGRTCQAVRHIEDVAAELDELRREVRSTERHHSEDMRKLWYKIGVLAAAIAAAVPTGWGFALGLIG